MKHPDLSQELTSGNHSSWQSLSTYLRLSHFRLIGGWWKFALKRVLDFRTNEGWYDFESKRVWNFRSKLGASFWPRVEAKLRKWVKTRTQLNRSIQKPRNVRHKHQFCPWSNVSSSLSMSARLLFQSFCGLIIMSKEEPGLQFGGRFFFFSSLQIESKTAPPEASPPTKS